MTDVILQWRLTSDIARAFLALSKLRLCCFITRFFSIGYRRGVFELILKYFSGVEVFCVCAIWLDIWNDRSVNHRRPASACSRKSSLIRVCTNCLSIATLTCACLSRRASECEVSDVVATVSARVRGEGGGGGGVIIKKRVCCLFDVRCHQHCSNKWQYLNTVYLFRGRAKSNYDGQLFIHVQFHVHIMKLAYVCS